MFEQNENMKLKLKSLHSLRSDFSPAQDLPCLPDIRLTVFRRIFVNFLEKEYFHKIASNNSQTSSKLEQFRQWLLQQYLAIKQGLLSLCLSDDAEVNVPAIRTILEVLHFPDLSFSLS
jgi:hypothetical protein